MTYQLIHFVCDASFLTFTDIFYMVKGNGTIISYNGYL